MVQTTSYWNLLIFNLILLNSIQYDFILQRFLALVVVLCGQTIFWYVGCTQLLCHNCVITHYGHNAICYVNTVTIKGDYSLAKLSQCFLHLYEIHIQTCWHKIFSYYTRCTESIPMNSKNGSSIRVIWSMILRVRTQSYVSTYNLALDIMYYMVDHYNDVIGINMPQNSNNGTLANYLILQIVSFNWPSQLIPWAII